MFSENNNSLTGMLSLLFSIATTVGIASQNSKLTTNQLYSFDSSPVENLTVDSIASLKNVFNEKHYSWPPSKIPPTKIVLGSLPENFSGLKNVKEKKRLFIQILLPIVQLENQRVVQQRNLALLLLKDGAWPEDEALYRIVKHVCSIHKIKTHDATRAYNTLLQRVDKLPTSLVIAQAAVESGWGSSRFALEGNSLFGQWSFISGNGMIPSDRDEGLSHEVKAFDSLRASVRSYLLNINTNHAYRELRTIRAKMRKHSIKMDAIKLAEGLHRYSQRKQEYVKEIKKILRSSDFQAISSLD